MRISQSTPERILINSQVSRKSAVEAPDKFGMLNDPTSLSTDLQARKAASTQWSIDEVQDSAVLEARRMFQNVLQSWAWDVLALQRAKVDQHQWSSDEARETASHDDF